MAWRGQPQIRARRQAAYPYGVMLLARSGDGLSVYPARPAAARSALAGEGFVNGETPVLDTLADITAASLEHSSLPSRELMLVRIAALIAVDAPAASYLANAEAAVDSGITADDIQAVMIGVAPVVGTPRVVSAGGNILRALGFAIAVADAETAGRRRGLIAVAEDPPPPGPHPVCPSAQTLTPAAAAPALPMGRA